MNSIPFDTFDNFISDVETYTSRSTLQIIYRGQNCNKPLIPSIARANPNINHVQKEQLMLNELKRRGSSFFIKNNYDNWDTLIYAQHFGLKTRLLDWTSNPLIALYFACCEETINEDCYLYMFVAKEKDFLDITKEKEPFKITSTKIIKPKHNNERIIAQSGWFTAHLFSDEQEKYIDLKTNTKFKDYLREYIIPFDKKSKILKTLNVLGINNQSVFADINGLCKHINWEFNNK